MINKALFKMEWKSSIKLMIPFMMILTLYITCIIMMYDPELGNILDEFVKAMPELMGAVGMNGPTGELIDFISTYLYGFIMIFIPLLFTVIVSLRLVSKKLDNGSMSYLLSSGVSRNTVWMTQFLVLISNVIVLIVYATGLGLLCSFMMFPNALDVQAYLFLNIGVLLLQILFAAIAYFASCAFNEYKNAVLIGGGVPLLMIIIQMLANMKGDLEIMKYFTIMTLFDPQKIIHHLKDAIPALCIIGVMAIVLFIVSNRIFNRKNMSL